MAIKLHKDLEPLLAVMGSQIATRGMCTLEETVGYDGRIRSMSCLGDELFTIKGAAIVIPPSGVVTEAPIVKIELRHDKTPSDAKLVRCTFKEMLQLFVPHSRNCPPDFIEKLRQAAVECMENIGRSRGAPIPAGHSFLPQESTQEPNRSPDWGAWA